jgi:hypothetical protein
MIPPGRPKGDHRRVQPDDARVCHHGRPGGKCTAVRSTELTDEIP